MTAAGCCGGAERHLPVVEAILTALGEILDNDLTDHDPEYLTLLDVLERFTDAASSGDVEARNRRAVALAALRASVTGSPPPVVAR